MVAPTWCAGRFRRRRRRRAAPLLLLLLLMPVLLLWTALVGPCLSPGPRGVAAAATEQPESGGAAVAARFGALPRLSLFGEVSDEESQDFAGARNRGGGGGGAILIVAGLDGTLAGLDRNTGEVLWWREPGGVVGTMEGPSAPREPPCGADAAILAPLVSTTTTTTTRTNTAASAASAAAASPSSSPPPSSSSSSTASTIEDFDRTLAVPWADGARVSLTARDVTVTTTLPALQARAPFLDARGRLYTAERTAAAFGLDPRTGRILRVRPLIGWGRSGGVGGDVAWDHHEESGETDEPLKDIDPDQLLWLGRVDESVSLFEPRSGRLDVRVGVARIMSMRDMLLEGTTPSTEEGTTMATDRSVSTHLSGAERSTLLRSWNRHVIVTTPSGSLALADARTGTVHWLARQRLAAPVAYAIDADTGTSVIVRIVQDAIRPNGSDEYLRGELERQLRGSLGVARPDAAFGDSTADEQSIVGSLPNGQLYATSLAGPSRQGGVYRSQTTTAAASGNSPSTTFHVTSNVGGYRNPLQTPHSRHRGLLCRPGNPDFPSCMSDLDGFGSVQASDGSFLTDMNADGGVVPIYGEYNYERYPEHYFTLPHYDEERHRKRRRYRQMNRILGSWLPPLIALVFVISFEIGRRKRQRESKRVDDPALSISQATDVGLIKVFYDSILGYGGHGTVVYKGMLEGRLVAVKRMLRAYHANADREIALLIESDGHPNVVRYFLKEIRGEFIYLALELCDLSLHDLIAVLRADRDAFDQDTAPSRNTLDATRNILLQIANGVMHLHSLRIVHRDLKPANILIASSNKSKYTGTSNETLNLFLNNEYVAKISDMGLGKQLIDQSSYGPSLLGDASLRDASSVAQSSMVGIGPGSVGWQAPEIMAMRMPSDASPRSDSVETESPINSASPTDARTHARTSRSADIFSLGCIFYSTLVPGCHPFGEWYEREANIMHGRPTISAVKAISADAYDLILSMVQRNYLSRPTAKQVCDHPLFWHDERRLSFLCDFSDRIESDAAALDQSSQNPDIMLALVVERKASDIVGLSWTSVLDDALVNNVQKFRTYDPSSIRDLLRLIRNKAHHFDELPNEMKKEMEFGAVGLLKYLERRFPSLLIHCFDVCRRFLPINDQLCQKYGITPLGRLSEVPFEKKISTITEQSSTVENDETHTQLEIPSSTGAVGLVTESALLVSRANELKIAAPINFFTPKEESRLSSLPKESMGSLPALDAGDIIIWEGSTSAKTFNCRGWSRSDDEWERRVVDSAIRRRDHSDLVRCSEDPRYRTRLCNYWLASLGASCPMRAKKKCIFAHGPVELRIKEGKRHRWGTLVDSNGDNKNRAHSGGEDTYGIAKSIEAERSSQGKCNIDKNGKPASKKPVSSARKSKVPDLVEQAN